MTFESFNSFLTTLASAPEADRAAMRAAHMRNDALTKPPGALGRLEDLALWYASWRKDPRPHIRHPQVIVFAGSHGVAARGVSAFPAEVTAQMVANFRAGGGAINQLAGLHDARLDVVAMSLDHPTADFTQGPAMGETECLAALEVGWQAVSPQSDLLVVGEMGIANTTAASAICAALLGGGVETWTGRGTGVDDAGLARKHSTIRKGLAINPARTPTAVLAAFGGRETAAMAGALARARVGGIPVILDGFCCSSAALVLHTAWNRALDHAVAGHVSAEAPHGRLLEAMGKPPLLSLGLRLGEASGATLAIGVLKAALACHSGMASFAEADVSTGLARPDAPL